MNDFPMIANVLLYVVAMNVLLTGLSKALELIKDKTKTNVDNKIYDALHKVTALIQKLVDAIGYNPAHK